jgi:hypothetical protein
MHLLPVERHICLLSTLAVSQLAFATPNRRDAHADNERK